LGALERHPAVIGPALDGGYYLIGLNRPQPDLFVGIDWSTKHVLPETLRRISRLGLTVEQLQPLEDIDTYDAARRLWKDLRERAPHRASNPRTTAILQRIFGVSASQQQGSGR
jgi:glycosyltransferase A (GT-A) superfamily protein (DUF2064 family)